MAPQFRMLDFECGNCDHRFEYTVILGEKEEIHCPVCDSKKVTQAIHAHAGYNGNLGGASTPPRGRGAFRGRKQ